MGLPYPLNTFGHKATSLSLYTAVTGPKAVRPQPLSHPSLGGISHHPSPSLPQNNSHFNLICASWRLGPTHKPFSYLEENDVDLI